MANDPLNFFQPFRRLEPNHENQLTRALLVVLRLSPMAHATWLRLVDPARQLHELPAAEFRTQTRAVRHANDDEERAALVSVFLTPEAPLSDGDAVITESDRLQVLDAVIDYDGELLVVVENKVAEDTDRQAVHLNIDGANLQIAEGQQAVVVLWRDLLEAFIALRERNLIAGAEATVLDDFLRYTEDHFPDLGPFRTLRLAHGNAFRQTRRLRQLLSESTGLEATIDAYGPYVPTGAGEGIGSKTYLRLTEDLTEIELALFPADTLSQARAFYTDRRAVAGARHLDGRPGWDVAPNFHFGHMQRGFCWTHSSRPVGEYLSLWEEHIAQAGSVPREEWDELWQWLQDEQLAEANDRLDFDQHFTGTNRQTASPRPGIALARRWPLLDAETLDSRGSFGNEVRDAVDEARAAFGDGLLNGPLRGQESGGAPPSSDGGAAPG